MIFPIVKASFGEFPTFVLLLLSHFLTYKGKFQILLRPNNKIGTRTKHLFINFKQIILELNEEILETLFNTCIEVLNSKSTQYIHCIGAL